MKRTGFALIELVLVIGIVGTVTGMAVPLYRDYQIRNDLNLATEQVTQGLARARLLAQSAQEDSGWGFYVPAGILYKGESYADRDPVFDEVYSMPSTITPTGLLEVAYAKLDGTPSETGEITLIGLNEERRSVFIEVQTESVAVVQNDTLTICHNPSGNPDNQETIVISEAAWPAHRDNHGDTLGPCEGDEPASSSSSSSSAGAGSSSSAGEGEGEGTATCEDRFSVAADGTITTTGPLSVQFDSLGAQFAYGNGGPDVPVTVQYRRPNDHKWKKLFDGDAINGNGGDSDTIGGYEDGDIVALKFRGYYKKWGWLTYDRSIVSDDDSDDVIVLRNGDPAPTIEGSGGQTAISELLQSVTVDGNISIGEYDVVMLADFNRQDCNSCSNNYCSDCSGVDYQDGVVLVKFEEPEC